MPKTPAVVDFGTDFAVDDTPVPTVLVKGVFGEDFKVVKDVNLFGYMAIADDNPQLSDLHRMILNLIADEDRVRFKSLVARQRNLKIDKLMELFKRLMEVASEERPTSSSAASSRSTRTKVAGALSAGNS